MSDFNYPPSRTVTLAAALGDVESDIEDTAGRIAQLEDDEDAEAEALAKARGEHSQLTSQRDALEWAVDGDGREGGFDGWGEDAEVTFKAFTATTRSRVLDTVNRVTMGPVGESQTRDWLISAGVQAAPWLDEAAGLEEKHEATGNLPPALRDWLNAELNDLNDLTSGN